MNEYISNIASDLIMAHKVPLKVCLTCNCFKNDSFHILIYIHSLYVLGGENLQMSTDMAFGVFPVLDLV